MMILAALLICQAPEKPYVPPKALRAEAEYHDMYMRVRAAATRSERDASEAVGGVPSDPDDPRLDGWLENYQKSLKRRLKETVTSTGKTFDELVDIYCEGSAREWHLESKERTVNTAEEARAELAERRRKIANLKAAPLLGRAIKAWKDDRAGSEALFRQIIRDYPDTDVADEARDWLERFRR